MIASVPWGRGSGTPFVHCLTALGQWAAEPLQFTASVPCGSGVMWCAEGAVTRRQWPGCLPTGTGKREGCVCCVCAVCECVFLGGKRGYAGVPAALPCGGGCGSHLGGGGGMCAGPGCGAGAGLHPSPRSIGGASCAPCRPLGLISSAAFLLRQGILPQQGILLQWCGVVWCGAVRCSAMWCGAVWCGVVWCGVVWCSAVQCDVVRCGVVWCSVM